MSATARYATPPPSKAKATESEKEKDNKGNEKDDEKALPGSRKKKFDGEKDSLILVALQTARVTFKVYPIRLSIFMILVFGGLATSALQKLGYMEQLTPTAGSCVGIGSAPDMSDRYMTYSIGFRTVNLLLLPVYYCGKVMYNLFYFFVLLKEWLFSIPVVMKVYDEAFSAVIGSIEWGFRKFLSIDIWSKLTRILDWFISSIIGMIFLGPLLLGIHFWETHKEAIQVMGFLCSLALAYLIPTYGLSGTINILAIVINCPIQLGIWAYQLVTGVVAALLINLSYWWALFTLKVVC